MGDVHPVSDAGSGGDRDADRVLQYLSGGVLGGKAVYKGRGKR